MPDIGLIWDPAYARGDWADSGQTPAGADDGTGGDLTAAVMVSLLSWRRASDDYQLADGSTNRKGCWTDSYEDEPIGSRLWQLLRSKHTVGARNQPALLAARDYCNEALAWMLKDGVASAVDVSTFWAQSGALGIVVQITLASGPSASISVTLPWAPSPVPLT